MPELPEVEVTKQGISLYIISKKITGVTIREHRLRWPIDPNLPEILQGQRILDVLRRSKYILIVLEKGHLIVHLGMSGRLCVVDATTPPLKHSHVDIKLEGPNCLRYTDARRFGAIIWAPSVQYPQIENHPLLRHLGVEPLSSSFTKAFLQKLIFDKKSDIKVFLMNAKYIVGIGNIYAQEALFLAHILPTRQANSLTALECKNLVDAIQTVLKSALEAGGTSFRDFIQADGSKGYFQLNLWVYGRLNQECKVCHSTLNTIKQGGRTTTYCKNCQR